LSEERSKLKGLTQSTIAAMVQLGHGRRIPAGVSESHYRKETSILAQLCMGHRIGFGCGS
jgi:hypothetical protein